jgi:hypothetical protein
MGNTKGKIRGGTGVTSVDGRRTGVVPLSMFGPKAQKRLKALQNRFGYEGVEVLWPGGHLTEIHVWVDGEERIFGKSQKLSDAIDEAWRELMLDA